APQSRSGHALRARVLQKLRVGLARRMVRNAPRYAENCVGQSARGGRGTAEFTSAGRGGACRPYETRLERRSVKPITPPSSQRGAQAPLRRSESGGARPSYRRPTPTPFATRRIEFGEVAARGSRGSTEEAGGVEGGVGEDDVGAGPSEADQALEQARVVVEVAALGGELEHGVLAAHLIRGDGEARALAHEANDVGVREARLHEQHVGAFGLVERDLAEALARVR